MSRCLFASLCAWVGLFAGPPLAIAYQFVIMSTAETVKPGFVLETGTSLEVPPGAHVTLLSPEGELQKLEGPTVYVESEKTSARLEGVVDTLSFLVEPPEGMLKVGAMRTRSRCKVTAIDLEEMNRLARRGCHDEATSVLDDYLADRGLVEWSPPKDP
ncbi:MAG: hypothetical protein ACFB6S_06215 [Geminicoccaceae bacterium]